MTELTVQQQADVRRIQTGINPATINAAHAAFSNEVCAIDAIRKTNPQLQDRHRWPDHLALAFPNLTEDQKLQIFRAQEAKEKTFGALANETEAVAKKLGLDTKTYGDPPLLLSIRAMSEITGAFGSTCTPKFPMPDINNRNEGGRMIDANATTRMPRAPGMGA